MEFRKNKKIRNLHKEVVEKKLNLVVETVIMDGKTWGRLCTKEWDENSQQWINHRHLSEKRKYSLRGNNSTEDKLKP